MSEERGDVPWTASCRVEAWTGELRVNVIRLAAIVAFYGHHLVNQHLFHQTFPARYSLMVAAIAVVWAVGALALHVALSGHWMPAALRYAAVGFDLIMATCLLMISDGPHSPLVAILFLVIATASLRLDLKLVWTATLLALLSYGFILGHAHWVRPEWQIPRSHQVIVVLALTAAGFLAGQQVRQARRFAADYADRVRPEETP